MGREIVKRKSPPELENLIEIYFYQYLPNKNKNWITILNTLITNIMTKLLTYNKFTLFQIQFTDQIFTVFPFSVHQKSSNNYNDKRKNLFSVRDN